MKYFDQIIGVPGAELVNPLEAEATKASRNPWGSVKTEQSLKESNAWIDEMLKSGMIDVKQAEALKVKAMQSPKTPPSDELYQDPKFLKKVFGK